MANTKMGKKKASKNKKGESWSKTVTVQRELAASKRFTEHQFIQNCGNAYQVQGLALGTVLRGVSFSLNQLPNFTNLTSLYDQYRIDKVELRFYFRSGGTTNNYPRLHVFPDFDDDSAPPTIADALAHPRVETHVFTPNRPEFRYALQPRMASAVYSTIVSTYAVAPYGMFADSASAATKFYGFKMAVENFTDTTQLLDIYFKFYLTCRNPL